jgi:hypothetical protein
LSLRDAQLVGSTLLHERRGIAPAPGGRETPGSAETRDEPQALSRRAALLVLASGLTAIGSSPPPEAYPTNDIVIIDGWILRIDDIERMRGGAG